MLACPVCGAENAENVSVCPSCRANFVEGGAAHAAGGRHSRSGARVVGIIVAIVALASLPWLILMPEVNRYWTASQQSESRDNLNNLAIAIHEYHDTHGSLPIAQEHLGGPVAAHGWQTHLLPWLDERVTHEAIDFHRWWDDGANDAPMRAKPAVFFNPGIQQSVDSRGYPLLHYAGNVHVLGRVPPLAFDDIRDGTSYTILIGEINDGLRPWGDPHSLRDPGLGLNAGPATFGSPWSDVVLFAAADGSVHPIQVSMPIDHLKALATPAGGER